MKYYLDLFAGIGGFALGVWWAGLEFDGHYFSEVDDYAIKIYRRRFPKAIVMGDVTKINYAALPEGEWTVGGGFPCQPHSPIGKRRASQDKRDLWPECARMLRELRPKIALFENVPELLVSDGGRFFNRVLSDMAECGYDAEWQVISAQEAGAPHLRKRLWIVAYPAGKSCKRGG
jgi:DNA (cytosine-5)-methyltransferase 1